MSDPRATAVDRLDPEIRRYIFESRSAAGAYPALDSVQLDEARHIANTLRRRWAQGGPEVTSIREYIVGLPAGGVRVRIYDPAPQRVKPALIYIHGGGWTLFSLDTHDRLMREYAAHAELCVVGVDYALSPEAKFPSAIKEVCAVAEWVFEHAEALNIDAGAIALGGDSAGANLSVASCLQLRDQDKPYVVQAMLLNYGVFDSDFERPSYRYFDSDEFALGRKEMIGFWQNYVRNEADLHNPLASVLRADLHGLPPVFMVIAECDVLYDENVAMAEMLRAAGVAVTDVVYPGCTHSFLEAVSIAEISRRALVQAADWLKRTLAGDA